MFMDESLWGVSVSCMNVYCCHEHGHIKDPDVSDPWEWQGLPQVRLWGMARPFPGPNVQRKSPIPVSFSQ